MPLAKINCPERVARLVRKNSNEQRVKALKDEKTAQVKMLREGPALHKYSCSIK